MRHIFGKAAQKRWPTFTKNMNWMWIHVRQVDLKTKCTNKNDFMLTLSDIVNVINQPVGYGTTSRPLWPIPATYICNKGLFCTKFNIVTSNSHPDNNWQKEYMGKIHYLDFKERVQFIIPTIIELSRGGVRAPLCSARNELRWKSQMSLAISVLCGRLMLLNGCVNILRMPP